MSLNKQIIIINNGSRRSINGFAGMEKPYSIIPTIIGYPNYEGMHNTKESYVGEEVIALRGVLKKISPIQGGVINDWNAIEKIWDYTFSKILKVLPDEHYVLLTEPPINPRRNKEKMAEIMFETFNVSKLYIANQAVLSLYASGRTTGCVVDIGGIVSYIVPIYDGIPITHAIKKTEVAGLALTKYMNRLIRQTGFTINTSAEREIMEDAKEKHCYVTLNAERELELAKEKTTFLINGMPSFGISLGDERFLVPEVLFYPSALGISTEPLDDLIVQAISETNITLRRDLYRNIVLSGGTSMLPGLKERLAKEIQEQIPESYDIEVVKPPELMYSAWIGGSLFASSPHNVKWITREEYYKSGPEIIHNY